MYSSDLFLLPGGMFGYTDHLMAEEINVLSVFRRELFLSEVNNRDNNSAIEANNDTYFLQKPNRKVSAVKAVCM